jgi:hypothetical protein
LCRCGIHTPYDTTKKQELLMASQVICILIKVYFYVRAMTVVSMYPLTDINQLLPLDIDVWEHLMLKATNASPFYSNLFDCLAESFLSRYYSMNTSGLTVSNIREIYCNLVDYFSIF